MQTIEITESTEIQRIVDLADTIWKEFYADLIGMQQVEYMLKRFQSFEAIRQQITKENYRYFVAINGSEDVGYCSLQKNDKNNELFLSKFYVRKTNRGQGIGKRLLADAINKFPCDSQTTVWLTVNKGNEASINAYKKLGFRIADQFVTDIGNGFVMDDYRLECPAAQLR